jgi:hypothetical protein
MPTERDSHGTPHQPKDPVESIIKAVPLVLPLMAGVLMFMLAFIAIYMA